MSPPVISKKDLFMLSIFSITIVSVIFCLYFFDNHTKIIFCNVGQGDAIYIRIKNKLDVLIDAGPDSSVLSCLGRHMPFWDRKIELAFLSHPNSDHYNGYFLIIDRYKIDKFITVDCPIFTKSYKKLLNLISGKKIPLKFGFSGDRISAENSQFIFYWPPREFFSSNDNDFSQVLMFQNINLQTEGKDFRLLLTGDASPFIMGRLSHGVIGKIDILKIPHHGSKNGLTKKFLELADPRIAVISVGKNNSYGHPNKEILDMLKAMNIKIKRTDEEGDIKFTL
jgi:competence protein ComEC